MSLNSVAEPTFDLEENVIGSMMLNKNVLTKLLIKDCNQRTFQNILLGVFIES